MALRSQFPYSYDSRRQHKIPKVPRNTNRSTSMSSLTKSKFYGSLVWIFGTLCTGIEAEGHNMDGHPMERVSDALCMEGGRVVMRPGGVYMMHSYGGWGF